MKINKLLESKKIKEGISSREQHALKFGKDKEDKVNESKSINENRRSDILAIKSNIEDNLVLDNYMGTGKSNYNDYKIELYHDSDGYGGYPWCYVISKDGNTLTKRCYGEDLSNTLYGVAQFIYNTEHRFINEDRVAMNEDDNGILANTLEEFCKLIGIQYKASWDAGLFYPTSYAKYEFQQKLHAAGLDNFPFFYISPWTESGDPDAIIYVQDDGVDEIGYVQVKANSEPIYRSGYSHYNRSINESKSIKTFGAKGKKKLKESADISEKDFIEVEDPSIIDKLGFSGAVEIHGNKIYADANTLRQLENEIDNLTEAKEQSINESNDVVYDMYKKQYKNLLQDIKYVLNSDNIEDIRAYDKESQGEYILSKLFDSRMNKQNMSFEDAKEDVIDFLYRTRANARSELELRNKRSLDSKSIMNKVKSELSKDYKLVSESENTLYFKAPDNSTHDDCIAFVDKVVAASGGKYTYTGRGGSWTLWDILTPEGSYIKAGYDYSNKDNYAVYFRSILTESRSTRSTSKESAMTADMNESKENEFADIQYGVHQFSTDSIIFRGTEEECGKYIDNRKELWDDAEVYMMTPDDPHYKKDLDEASYGGAFDIEDDQYFTREEINELGEDVVIEIGQGFELTEIYLTDNILEITIENDELGSFSTSVKIDMRRISKPRDIFKYKMDLVSKLDRQIEAYKQELSINESLKEDIEMDSLEAPKQGPEFGLSDLLNNAIKSEFDAISIYNELSIAAESEGYDDIVNIIADIATEENKHVGQLQEALKLVAPQAKAIEIGYKEGQEQIEENDSSELTESVDGDELKSVAKQLTDLLGKNDSQATKTVESIIDILPSNLIDKVVEMISTLVGNTTLKSNQVDDILDGQDAEEDTKDNLRTLSDVLDIVDINKWSASEQKSYVLTVLKIVAVLEPTPTLEIVTAILSMIPESFYPKLMSLLTKTNITVNLLQKGAQLLNNKENN